MSERASVPTILDDAELDAEDRAFADDVREHGFRWIRVGESEQDALNFPEWRDTPAWSYTIGLYGSFGHPELVAFWLEREIAGALFWDLADAIKAGRTFRPGEIYSDALPSFDGQRFSLEAVSPDWIPSLFGTASWFYKGADFPIFQYLWPDRSERFVWEPEVTEDLYDVQPDLTEAPEYDDAPPRPREPLRNHSNREPLAQPRATATHSAASPDRHPVPRSRDPRAPDPRARVAA